YRGSISLPKGTIMNKSNLDYINFDKKGEVNQFGSVYISYDKEIYRLIFHIEKGRIRYEKV
ncbi:competence protein, partial [Staphylococcus pettenkoferi]|nr:competence protein [Staphylococcus pettenkoferi]